MQGRPLISHRKTTHRETARPDKIVSNQINFKGGGYNPITLNANKVNVII